MVKVLPNIPLEILSKMSTVFPDFVPEIPARISQEIYQRYLVVSFGNSSGMYIRVLRRFFFPEVPNIFTWIVSGSP